MKTCKIENYNRKHHAKEFCDKHYRKYMKYGDPLFAKRKRENHGMSYTAIYRTWSNMLNRCYYKNSTNYDRYGGRGITVCDRWRKSLITFYADMGDKPFPKAELDRINNDGNYEPGNCRWLTHVENARKTSRIKLTMEIARKIRQDAKTMKNMEIAKKYSISDSAISRILKNERWNDILIFS